ncbi:hypothetical protein T265_13570, partial [Opisthorchis viverrini]
PLDVDQTDNAPSTCSASQPCIRPRQRESALIKVRQRPRNMQHVTASYQSQAVCVSIGLSSGSDPPISSLGPLYIPTRTHLFGIWLLRSLLQLDVLHQAASCFGRYDI